MSPAALNAVNPVPTPSGAGKPQDAAAPDTPFSQVLSSEIAHSRDADRQKGSDADADAAAEPAPLPGGLVEDGTAIASQAALVEAPAGDPLDPAAGAPGATDALLALVSHPDSLKLAAPIPAAAEDARGAAPPIDAEARGKRAAQALRAGLEADAASDTRKAAPALPGKPELQSPATAAATAFSGQLAAARQADVAKKAEFTTDLVGAAMRSAQAPYDVQGMSVPATPEQAAAGRLAPSVGSAAWSQALGDRLVWMAAGAQQTATLTLNPPNLGPLQIELNLSNEQATASFFSAQPEVRQALEAAFPRLREMMNDAGIQLGQATVSADTPRQHETPDRQAQRGASALPGLNEVASAEAQTLALPIRQSGRGLVDTFA